MSPLLLVIVVFFAIFTQSVAGFGMALVIMPLLSPWIGLTGAAALNALLAIVVQVYMIYRYRTALEFSAVWRMIIASLIAIPIGLQLVELIPASVGMTLLGVIVITYALYALARPSLPHVTAPGWAWLFGFLGGLLSGAYSTSGPVVVVYASFRRWEAAQFKGNLQAYFICNVVFGMFMRGLAGHYTPVVWESFVIAFPALVLGAFAGVSLDRYINNDVFRKIVLVMLVVLGLSLIF